MRTPNNTRSALVPVYNVAISVRTRARYDDAVAMWLTMSPPLYFSVSSFCGGGLGDLYEIYSAIMDAASAGTLKYRSESISLEITGYTGEVQQSQCISRAVLRHVEDDADVEQLALI